MVTVTFYKAPIETLGSIGVVKRYYAFSRLAYQQVQMDWHFQTTVEKCLKLMVFAIKRTTGPEGLRSVLLVFGADSRPKKSAAVLTQLERAVFVDKSRKEPERDRWQIKSTFRLKQK